MATLSGTSSVTPLQRQGASPRHIVLVGAHAQAARPLLEQLLEATTPNLTKPEFLTAASFLEAALITGEQEGEPARLILAGIPTDEDVDQAVRTLRRINPRSSIVLLCEPQHEAMGRKARTMGADDYFILPLDAASARQLLAMPHHTGAEAVRRPASVTASAHPAPGADLDFDRSPGSRRAARASAEIASDLPSLPLLVQTELLEELFTERTDFPDRALGVLSRYIRFNGTLRFVPATPANTATEPETPTQIRRPVAIADQPAFGTLILEVTAAHHATPQAAAVVAQAANWLAGMLALLRRYEQLRSLAITDELSGAFNRRYFLKYMSSLLEKAKENRSRVTLLLFDIDDFKRYNDTFGHASGDAIIRELIKLLRACTREYDLVARIGGDEFAVVYRDNEAPRQPNSEHPKDVLVATERFREAIKNHHWPQTCNIKGEVSISGGLATFPWDADNLETLMAKADEALLKAKAAGKNVIVMHAAATASTGAPNDGM